MNYELYYDKIIKTPVFFGEIFLFIPSQDVFPVFAYGIVYPSSVLAQQNTRMYIIHSHISKKELYMRYKIMAKDNIEVIKSEIEDDYSDDSLFNISSWGADLSFREICSMYDENELVKPELQRKYVWDKVEASRFIESILMGLPVPSVFFAQSGSQKLIVDGYQRIMTVHDYISGIFSEDGKVFRLSNSEKINRRWRNKSFVELTTDDQRKIKSTTIHAIIFEQKKPENGDTSLYQVFERINTSGRTLTPQEIRNCVYQGSFNSMLFTLNKNESWRELFGVKNEDTRMRDLECIVRFFLMKSSSIQESTATQISLKKSLNDFMFENRNIPNNVVDEYTSQFNSTINAVKKLFGINAFHNYSNGKYSKKFHPAIFDAIMVGVYNLMVSKQLPESISEVKHKEILQNQEFINAITTRTTDIENIHKRVAIVSSALGANCNEN